MTNKIITNIFNKYLDDNIILLIDNNNLDLKKSLSIYNSINKELLPYNINSYEINNLIEKINCNNYNKFIKYKNKQILSKAYKSSLWNENLKYLERINESNQEIKDIQKKLLKLFKSKYINNWDGFWTLIKIDIRGTILEINTIDIDDLNYLIK